MTQATLLTELKDRVDIEALVLRYALSVDTQDWAAFETIFAKDVDVDFTAVGAPSITTMPREVMVAQVKQSVPGFGAVQHQFTNLMTDIDGDRANCVAYVQAEHFLTEGGEQLEYGVGGYYTFGLQRIKGVWIATSLKLNVLWRRGDLHALEIATQRAAA